MRIIEISEKNSEQKIFSILDRNEDDYTLFKFIGKKMKKIKKIRIEKIHGIWSLIRVYTIGESKINLIFDEQYGTYFSIKNPEDEKTLNEIVEYINNKMVQENNKKSLFKKLFSGFLQEFLQKKKRKR